MRTTTRTLTASLLAAPLVVGAVAPTQAAPPERYSASGTFAGAYGTIVGQVDGADGNVHLVDVSAQIATDSTGVYGYLESYDCPEGVTDPWSEEEGPVCEFLSFYQLVDGGATVTIDRQATSATIEGPLDIVEVDCDEVDCWETVVGTLNVDLSLTTSTKKAAVNRYTYSYRDPNTGVRYRGTMSESTRDASVSGTVAGNAFNEASGRVGTFSFRETAQQR
jgi:hypothetical protein